MKEELFRRGLAVALINLEHEPELDVLQAVHGASSAIATPHRVGREDVGKAFRPCLHGFAAVWA